jgi:hypothetical protein
LLAQLPFGDSALMVRKLLHQVAAGDELNVMEAQKE